MYNLTHDQEMKLSELLFKLIKPDECWHEGKSTYENGENIFEMRCTGGCNQIFRNYTYIPDNPNLFTRSAFLDVFDAVKDEMYVLNTIMRMKDWVSSPKFQLAVLKWLLEKDGRLGELEEVMKGEGE